MLTALSSVRRSVVGSPSPHRQIILAHPVAHALQQAAGVLARAVAGDVDQHKGPLALVEPVGRMHRLDPTRHGRSCAGRYRSRRSAARPDPADGGRAAWSCGLPPRSPAGDRPVAVRRGPGSGRAAGRRPRGHSAGRRARRGHRSRARTAARAAAWPCAYPPCCMRSHSS